MRNRPVAITDLPPSPADEQAGRMRRYALTMGIRTLCVIACVVTPGWWLLIPALGAVFLPYVAVVLANAVTRRRGAPVEGPGGIVPRPPSS
jgi:Protein of unknown function (DUF3099).